MPLTAEESLNDVTNASSFCTLDIQGMTCASCVIRVENALKKIPGVEAATVNLATEQAKIRFQESATASSQVLIEAVKKAGYEATKTIPHHSHLRDQQNNFCGSEGLGRVIFSFSLSFPLVLPMLLMLFGIHLEIPAQIQLSLAAPVQLILGWRFYRNGFKALIAGSGNMDLLVALGTSSAFLLSVYLMLQDQNHELYFESSAVVISMVLLGKWLELNAKFKTSAAIRALQKLWPENAHVLNINDEVRHIPSIELLPGDRVKVFPGERIPVDGVILNGISHIDESLMTGESNLVFKNVGSLVIGGSMNGDGLLIIQAQAIGEESTLAKMIQLVEDAQTQKAPIQKLVDQISAVFVPTVFVIALLTALLNWYFFGSVSEAILRAVAVMVIACPCALGLATPAAIMAGTGVAARFGILIKDSQVLEIAHRLNIIAFDKTGTLTKGQPELLKTIFLHHDQHLTNNDLLELAGGLQLGSEHPIAKAFLNYLAISNIQARALKNMKALPGIGIEGEMTDGPLQGIIIRLQSLQSLALEPCFNDLQSQVAPMMGEGLTISILTMKSIPMAIFGLGDEIKPESKAVISRLRAMGITTVMLSGDNKMSAESIGKSINIDQIYAQVLPIDKVAHIQQLQLDKNHQRVWVAMVGDGVNDAPSLVVADVGIAMGTGTEVAMQAASITLMRGDLNLVSGAIEISKKTWNKIRQNLFWAFFFNVFGIPLAALGFLSPMVAGSAMALSSFFVLSNALLLSRWKPSAQKS
jgi:Cu+-exporting ATPase